MSFPVYNVSLALGDNPAHRNTPVQKAALGLVAVGVLALTVAFFRPTAAATYPLGMLALGWGSLVVGGLWYIWQTYATQPPGIRNHGITFSSTMARGALGWLLGLVLTGGYILLYFFPATLEGLVRMVDPVSYALRGKAANHWFFYGFVYTVAVLVMGVRALLKYRHSRYQVLRTLSVMFFQLGFAFLLPHLLVRFQQGEFYLHYFWPLDYDFLFPRSIAYFQREGALGLFVLAWGVILLVVATPILTYFFGKRWYCSWVCGCGGLAETAGDPFRHLSDKSVRAWRIERWMIHGVLVLITVTTALLWINEANGQTLFGGFSDDLAKAYGFYIGLIFAGVVGTGFYPILGSRVWCRFGCPMAALLGLQQRFFSRFRITTNGGQCIACGNCSAYCEMGIDVRWYAQRGQNIVRASCVGCGICSAVCPRGVLNLENGPQAGRVGTAKNNLIADLDILK